MIKDITYCTNINCKRDCERRMDNKNFRDKIFSFSNFNCNIEDFNEDECEYYMKENN